MSPRITPISWKRFDRFLLNIGCKLVRQEGDHRIYTKSGLSRPIVIPMEKDLPVFIIKNNLDILGISREEYLKLLATL